MQKSKSRTITQKHYDKRRQTMTNKLIVVAPTYYASVTEGRFQLAKETCSQAYKHQIRIIIIDGSPLDEDIIYNEFTQNGQFDEYVKVIPQQAIGKKGVALREGIAAAVKELNENKDGDDSPNIIAFQEPEKVDMIRHWKSIVEHMTNTSTGTNFGIVLPRRSDESFRRTYPIEQYHAETFGNMYLNILGSKIGLPNTIDWTIGPIAFDSNYAKYWLEYTNGDLWDAQLIPMIRAFVTSDGQIKISANYEIDYEHPTTMKEEEQDSVEWCEKRLYQLQVLKDTVGDELKKAAITYPSPINEQNDKEHPECFVYNCC